MSSDQEIHDQQKQIWNTAAPGWKKWDPFIGKSFEAVSDAILDAAGLKEGHEVLELACGTGEPGIPAAKRVGKGRVTGTDLAEDMMEVAVEKAKAHGVHNYVTKLASALSLPFPDAHFDALLCRWGIMFFPDPPACLKEAIRVLKPGARAVFATWNVPQKNPHVSLPLSVGAPILGMEPPPPDAPGIFRYADAKKLSDQMAGAGFQDLRIEEVAGVVKYDHPGHYWEMVMDVVGPFKAAMGKSTPPIRQQVQEAVQKRVSEFEKDGKIVLNFSSWVVSGRK